MTTPETTTTRDEAVLRYYADTFCELGSHHECCGKLNKDECSGCLARSALASAPAPASGRVDAVARRAKYLLNRLETDDGLGIGEIDTMLRMAASLSPAATPVSEAETVTMTRQQIDGLLRAAYPLATASERAGALEAALAKPAVRPEDLQLLDRLRRDNVLGGARPVVSGGEELAQAWRLSEDGLIALEQVARGVRLHITRKGVAALSQSTSAGRVGE